jgi:hypothetical protein
MAVIIPEYDHAPLLGVSAHPPGAVAGARRWRGAGPHKRTSLSAPRPPPSERPQGRAASAGRRAPHHDPSAASAARAPGGRSTSRAPQRPPRPGHLLALDLPMILSACRWGPPDAPARAGGQQHEALAAVRLSRARATSDRQANQAGFTRSRGAQAPGQPCARASAGGRPRQRISTSARRAIRCRRGSGHPPGGGRGARASATAPRDPCSARSPGQFWLAIPSGRPVAPVRWRSPRGRRGRS